MSTPFSLYIHIPFCAQRCPYCDFNTYVVSKIPEVRYVDALLRELDQRAALEVWRGRPLQTIFFGGGTPSIFSPQAIGRVITAAFGYFGSSSCAEVTLEANPGAVNLEKLVGLRAAGVNRLSFGAQSSNSTTLKVLGRIHTPDDTAHAVRAAREAGFENLSLDIIFGVPQQTPQILVRDIETLMALAPEHISAYSLTIEKGTPFYEQRARGTLVPPNDDETAEMMELLIDQVSAAGYEHYEISNFAKPGRQARHNLAYWYGEDYLGLGAGAHSFCAAEGAGAGRRWSNYALPEKYMSEAEQHGSVESWSDVLSAESRRFEFFFMGLRLMRGISLSQLRETFGVESSKPLALLDRLEREGFLLREGDLMRLSRRGILLADSVIEQFAPGA